MLRLLLSMAIALLCLEVNSQISSFPHNESFESSSPSWTGIETRTTCNPNSNWNRDASGTGSSNTGPSSGQDGSYYIYTEASSPCNTTTAYKTKYAYSPTYNFAGKSSASIDFYYHRYGSGLGPMSLEVSTNGSTWTSIWSITSTASSNQWLSATVSLNSYLTPSTQLRFKGEILTSWSSDMAIDNVTVDASGSSGSPDLTVESLSAPSSATAGSNITASCTIRNSGTASASSSTMAYYISTNSTYDGGDTQLGTDPVGTLSAGGTSAESASLTIPAGLSSGTYYILFRADYTNAVAESNESNNVGARSISITAAPSCSDGIQNGDETGVDCGGSCPACPPPGSSLWSQNGSSIYYNSGNVGIGLTAPTEKLSVNGTVLAKEYRATLSGWPDYVFYSDYNLPTLREIENHINENGHLPNIPSASQVEIEGIHLAEMNAKLLEKIEELTLHMIQLNKELEKQSKLYKDQIQKIQNDLEELKSIDR